MKLLIQPSDDMEPLLKSIGRSKTCIELAIFRFDHKGIEEARTSAVKRGVSVHALIAHVNGSGAVALRKLEMRLLAARVTVADTDNGPARDHSKSVLIDRHELFVLAFNFTYLDIVSRAAKIAKIVAKAVTQELAPLVPVLDDALQEVLRHDADVNVDPAEVDATVRQEEKDAVKRVIQQGIEQKVEVASAPNEKSDL